MTQSMGGFRGSGPVWLAVLGIALAAGLALLVLPESRAQRLSNLDITRTTFPDTYIMFSKSEAGRCFVVDRRESTMRRDDAGTPGRKWDCAQFRTSEDPASLESWFVRSKRLEKGTVLFIPVDEVADWAYPFVYDFVRQRHPDLDLPALGWTQLFVNRVYRGLYLRMTLPFDARKKDGGSGVLREILTVRGTRLTKIDTRFQDARHLFVDSVAASRFPALGKPPAALAWLASVCPTEGMTFLLSNRPPHDVTLLPLPVLLPDLYQAMHGRAPGEFEDARASRWVAEALGQAQEGLPPFRDSDLPALRLAFEDYARSLSGALLTHGEFHRTLDAVRSVLPARQKALAGLELRLRGI